MRKLAVVPGGLALAAVLIAASLPAQASTAEETEQESVSQYLGERPEISVVDAGVLESDGAVVVGRSGETLDSIGLPDVGDPPTTERAASQQALAAAGCSYRNAAFVNQTGWQQSVDGCSIIGWDWTARLRYDWKQDIFGWNSGPSCVQGRGYSTNRTVSTPVWYNAGCGNGGSADAFIGNRATVAKIRGHVNAIAKIGYVRWK